MSAELSSDGDDLIITHTNPDSTPRDFLHEYDLMQYL